MRSWIILLAIVVSTEEAEKQDVCTQGYPGIPGNPGHNGVPGRDGHDGLKGDKGDTGTVFSVNALMYGVFSYLCINGSFHRASRKHFRLSSLTCLRMKI